MRKVIPMFKLEVLAEILLTGRCYIRLKFSLLNSTDK